MNNIKWPLFAYIYASCSRMLSLIPSCINVQATQMLLSFSVFLDLPGFFFSGAVQPLGTRYWSILSTCPSQTVQWHLLWWKMYSWFLSMSQRSCGNMWTFHVPRRILIFGLIRMYLSCWHSSLVLILPDDWLKSTSFCLACFPWQN